jgi:hypothetical protein
MAQRLETYYVKACLELTEAEMESFIQLLTEHQASIQVKVLEDGHHEVLFLNESEEDNVLSFERKFGNYVSLGSFRLTNPNVANVMRQVVSLFKGNAVVERIYPDYTMIYEYEHGSVVKISEMKNGKERSVYSYANKLGQIETQFRRMNAEYEIVSIQREIDQLLDLRNVTLVQAEQNQIDEQLYRLSHKLFVLEA